MLWVRYLNSHSANIKYYCYILNLPFYLQKKGPKKPTDQQIRCLIDFMERHEDFANGRAENAEDLWHLLLTLLHANRGPVKTLAAWKRVRCNLTILYTLFLYIQPLCELHAITIFFLFLLRGGLYP